jgi:hypothetical protein
MGWSLRSEILERDQREKEPREIREREERLRREREEREREAEREERERERESEREIERERERARERLSGSDGAEASVNKYALYVKDELGCSIRQIPDRSTANFQPWRQTAAPTPFQCAVCAELNKLVPESLPRRLVQAFAESDTFLQAPCEARDRLQEALLLAICYFAIPKTAGDELSRKVVVWHDRVEKDVAWYQFSDDTGREHRHEHASVRPLHQDLWRKLRAISTFEWGCFSRAHRDCRPGQGGGGNVKNVCPSC